MAMMRLKDLDIVVFADCAAGKFHEALQNIDAHREVGGPQDRGIARVALEFIGLLKAEPGGSRNKWRAGLRSDLGRVKAALGDGKIDDDMRVLDGGLNIRARAHRVGAERRIDEVASRAHQGVGDADILNARGAIEQLHSHAPGGPNDHHEDFICHFAYLSKLYSLSTSPSFARCASDASYSGPRTSGAHQSSIAAMVLVGIGFGAEKRARASGWIFRCNWRARA